VYNFNNKGLGSPFWAIFYKLMSINYHHLLFNRRATLEMQRLPEDVPEQGLVDLAPAPAQRRPPVFVSGLQQDVHGSVGAQETRTASHGSVFTT
jgi:hypothetical protein